MNLRDWAKKNDAEVYATEEEAKMSPAHRHWSANWKVLPQQPTEKDAV